MSTQAPKSHCHCMAGESCLCLYQDCYLFSNAHRLAPSAAILQVTLVSSSQPACCGASPCFLSASHVSTMDRAAGLARGGGALYQVPSEDLTGYNCLSSAVSIFTPELSLGQPLCTFFSTGPTLLVLHTCCFLWETGVSQCCSIEPNTVYFLQAVGGGSVFLPHGCQPSGMVTSSVLLLTLLCRCHQHLLCVTSPSALLHTRHKSISVLQA